MRASDFAIAALYTLSVLDKEVAKLQAPGGSKQRPADAYAIVEVTVYIARNLRRAISVGQELGMTTTKMLMLCDSVEGALAKDDLPGAASALLSDSPAGKWVREVLQKLCGKQHKLEMNIPARLPTSAPSAPRPGTDRAALMRACFPGSDIPVLGFGTGIFYTDATTVKKSIEHAARTLGYAHFDAAQGYHNEELVGEALRGALPACNHTMYPTPAPHRNPLFAARAYACTAPKLAEC